MKFKTKIFQSGNNTGISAPEKIIESIKVALKYYNTLSNSRGKNLVLQVIDAKTEETRMRRIEKIFGLLNNS